MKTNKQIKQMIASVTGGEWVNCWSSPSLLFFGWGFPSKLAKKHYRYHKTVSIKASEVK